MSNQDQSLIIYIFCIFPSGPSLEHPLYGHHLQMIKSDNGDLIIVSGPVNKEQETSEKYPSIPIPLHRITCSHRSCTWMKMNKTIGMKRYSHVAIKVPKSYCKFRISFTI